MGIVLWREIRRYVLVTRDSTLEYALIGASLISFVISILVKQRAFRRDLENERFIDRLITINNLRDPRTFDASQQDVINVLQDAPLVNVTRF